MIKNSIKNTLLLTGLALLVGCDPKPSVTVLAKFEENPVFELRVSHYKNFETTREPNVCIGYAGMPSKETFSLTKTYSYYSAINLYYPTNAKNIDYKG
jgi:hypothetical protein